MSHSPIQMKPFRRTLAWIAMSPMLEHKSLSLPPRALVLALLPALLLALPTAGHARRGEAPPSRSAGTEPLNTVALLPLPPVDAEARLAEDAANLEPGGLRYAMPVEVAVTADDHGTWQPLAGGRLWRLRVHSPGATDLNFGFTRFHLPYGASLHVVSESEDYYEGPYTHEDNEDHGQLWTPVVPGDRAVIELFVPEEVKTDPVLELTRVGTGYRDVLRRGPGSAAKQGACNIDVICPEGDPWRDQIRSEATYSRGGSLICSGQMIADVPGSFRNFFLTANHCGMNAGNAPSMVVYWNYESPNCGDLSGGSLDDNQTGATFLASRSDVDFALVELDDPPDPASTVFYTGWDRSGVAALGSVAIHHPSTDEKAISFNDDLLTSDNSCIGSATPDTHWWVDNWEMGTTEPGSSGSGLWDPATKKLIGFLSGGLASCTNIDYDCYGKFAVAWDGAGPGSRLEDHLDPGDTGTMMVEGGDPSPVVHYDSHQGADTCASDSGNDNGFWEPGELIELQVGLRSTGSFTDVQGTLTSPTPGVFIVDGDATWPDLTSGVPATSDAPHFTVFLEDTVACFGEVELDLEITTAEDGPFDASFRKVVGAPLAAEVPAAIPDNGGAGNPGTSDLAIAQDVSLTDVDLRVEIQHTYVGDLQIILRSPLGTEVVLLDRPGVPASTFGCSDDNMDVTFDGDSGVDLETHCAGSNPWYAGVAAPVGSLADFNGESSMGAWTLLVSDHAGQDTGTIVGWELLTTPVVSGECNECFTGPGIFADGFESGDTSRWSATVGAE